MRTASSNLTAHLAGEVTSIAICWKLTLVGGVVMGFTDHTADLTISSQLYKAATGFSPTSIETKDKFSVDNLDVAGILDAASITEVDTRQPAIALTRWQRMRRFLWRLARTPCFGRLLPANGTQS